jgi:hypothetical protein
MTYIPYSSLAAHNIIKLDVDDEVGQDIGLDEESEHQENQNFS